MKPVIYLRAASLLTLLHAVLHTIGGVYSKPDAGPQQAAVAAMKANEFPLMGTTRSYWSFHMGLGLAVTILLTIAAVVLWQLGTLAKTESHRLRPIYWAFLAGFVAMAVDSYAYFFPPPVITELVIAACLAGAIFTSRSSGARQS
jgi:CDP-diglyceride synthetase